VERIDEICATPGLTGVYVGPADLAIGLGLPVGGLEAPAALKQAFAAIAAACARHGVLAAGHFALPHLTELKGLGFRMFTVGSDRRYIALGAAADLRGARAALDGSA
jgi:2-keto-3-deoxy-L-rhamnonate aldolase RhmA